MESAETKLNTKSPATLAGLLVQTVDKVGAGA